MGSVYVDNCQGATSLPEGFVSIEQRAEAGVVKSRQMVEIEHHTSFASRYEAVQFRANVQILLTEGKLPGQSKNLDPFLLPIGHSKRHVGAIARALNEGISFLFLAMKNPGRRFKQFEPILGKPWRSLSGSTR